MHTNVLSLTRAPFTDHIALDGTGMPAAMPSALALGVAALKLRPLRIHSTPPSPRLCRFTGFSQESNQTAVLDL